MSADLQNNAAPEPTEEDRIADLQEKWLARNGNRARPQPTSGSNSPVRVIACPDCGAKREVPAVAVGGRVLFAEAEILCRECREARERSEEEARRREAEAEAERAREKRRASVLDLLREAGVNVWDHRDATFDNFDTRQAGAAPLEAARQFVAETKAAVGYDQVRGLYLCGDTGSGKSHLAVAVAREFLLDPSFRRGEIVFDHALRLIGRIQRTYSNEESADEVLNRRINARVWILDDLGTEAPSPDVVRRLTEIFTERAMRPTLVTSNLPPSELEGRHAEFFRVVSRLGPRYFRTVAVRGSDRRFAA